MAEGSHPFPYRTRKLSPPAPMVLGRRLPGRVGRRRISPGEGRPPGRPSSRIASHRCSSGHKYPDPHATDQPPGRGPRPRRPEGWATRCGPVAHAPQGRRGQGIGRGASRPVRTEGRSSADRPTGRPTALGTGCGQPGAGRPSRRWPGPGSLVGIRRREAPGRGRPWRGWAGPGSLVGIRRREAPERGGPSRRWPGPGSLVGIRRREAPGRGGPSRRWPGARSLVGIRRREASGRGRPAWRPRWGVPKPRPEGSGPAGA